MEFYIEKHSSVPVVAQIEEQIKLAVAMGTLRNGDKLPSIRDVEKQTGVNRGKIHRAYLSLGRSGLLVLARRRGVVIAAPEVPTHSTSQECLRLSQRTIRKARQLGIPPVAFARYLSRQAHEAERDEPSIVFVDDVKEVAESRAEQISTLWQVPIPGMTIKQLKAVSRKGSVPRKIMANHLRRDVIRSLITSAKIDVIPIEVVYTAQTIKDLAKIKARSSVLRILAGPYVKHARFIMAQLQKWIRASDVKVSWISIGEITHVERLLRGSQYDRIIIDPGILNEVPSGLLHHPKFLIVRLQLHPASLEAARIRAGVII